MKCLRVDPIKKEVQSIDIQMQANTVYSFFNSILIDEMPSIKEHIIYADGNALSEGKTPYFIGEQLVLGDALIVGVDEMMAERDVTIPQADLEAIINYEVPTFYKDVLSMVQKSDLNLYRAFEVQKDGQPLMLNAEWVLYTFEIANEATRNYFKEQLQQTLKEGGDVADFFKKMAQLAVNASS